MADYDIVSAFKRIEDELIASMIRNLERHRAEENDLGINWEQWQVVQLQALEEYKQRNYETYKKTFKELNARIPELIRLQREAGNAEQEAAILEAVRQGAGLQRAVGRQADASARFFRMNDRRMNALIKATTDDLEKAEYAMLRMSNDKYRKVIYNAQVYAASGAGTYEKAVDMATKDFLQAGINCVEYKNGARHTISDYADMAIRTAGKRAKLTGEGEMRKQWGISTVIMNRRGNPCPKCLPFVGKVLIDDVWSGGSRKDGPYPLMSSAIAAGLYHPRCKDGHTTYFPGISEAPDDKFTRKELENIQDQNRQEGKEQYAERQAESYERLAKNSLDEDNRRIYGRRAKEWKEQYENNDVSSSTNTWAKEAKSELLADERALSRRRTETAVVYDSQGAYLFQKRGTKNEVLFSISELLKLKGNVVTHNHPSGSSFSAQDIFLLKWGKLAELRVITETGVFYIRPPKQWSKEINSLGRIQEVKREIQKKVALKYQSLYNSNEISRMQCIQIVSDEAMRIFAERYGMEYGWEAFED